MVSRIPHFEATEALFTRALSGGLDSVVEAETTRPRGPWRALRLNRLEGIDPHAQVPPPLLALSSEAAVGVAEPEPEETPPSPQDLEVALSEAVDLPDDWAMAAALAGGTNIAHCLRELLRALDWNGAPRQVAEVLPALNTPLDAADAVMVMARLGFRCRSFRARLNELGPQDFPALFTTKSGDVLVLERFGQNSLPGFDGATRTRRPIARDRRAGRVHVFTAAEPMADTAPPAEPLAFLRSLLRGRLRAMGTVALVQGMLALAGPLLLLVALDDVVPSAALPMILFFTGAAALTMVFEIPFRAWRDRMAAPVATAAAGLALGALTRTLFLPPETLKDTTAGARRSRFDDFHAGGAEPAVRLVRAALGLPAAVIALAAVAYLAGALVAAPVFGVLAVVITGWVLKEGVRSATARAVAAAGESAQNWFESVRVRADAIAAGCEDAVARRIERAAAEMARTRRDAADRTRRVALIGRWIAGATVAATAAAGAYLSLSDGLSQGALAASVLLTAAALRAVARVTDEAGNAARLWCGLTQAGRLHAIRAERSAARPSLPPRTLAGHVDVSGLSTASTGGIEMPLDDVSLYADPGEVVVVVGDYQSGKSALLRVLAGLEPTAAGHARLDGVETGLFDPVQLRQSVAYVPELPEFLPLSIEDNLRLMNPVASEADIQSACNLAGVMEDIRVLETGVGSNRRFGLAVNTGLIDHDPQPGFLKRVALARGYVRRSGLLLLDGPERHLDPDGEQALLRAIEELRGTTTVIVATDRPQIIRLADRVIWLEGGRTRAEGPSSAVLEQLYAEGRVGQTLAEQ
jgi:ABC-type bacteriocin/lantibiotic exporter with double-glycine peptidase domain